MRSPFKIATPGAAASPLTSDTRSSTGAPPSPAASPADQLPSGRRPQALQHAWTPEGREGTEIGTTRALFPPNTPPNRSNLGPAVPGASNALPGANTGATSRRLNDIGTGQAPRPALDNRAEDNQPRAQPRDPRGRGALSPARDPQGQSGNHHKNPPQVALQQGGYGATPLLQQIFTNIQDAQAPQAVLKSLAAEKAWEIQANKVKTVEDAPVLKCRGLVGDGNQGQSNNNVMEEQGFEQAMGAIMLGSLEGNKVKIMKGIGHSISKNMSRNVPEPVTQATVTNFTQETLDSHFYDLIHVVLAWNYLKRYCIAKNRMTDDGEATFDMNWKRELLTALHLADSVHPIERDESLKDRAVREGARGLLGQKKDGALWAFSADMCQALKWELVVWIDPKTYSEEELRNKMDKAKKNNQEFNQSTYELTGATAKKEARALSIRGQGNRGQNRSPSNGAFLPLSQSKSSPTNLSNETAAREAAREGSQTRQAPVAPEVEDRPEEKQSTMPARSERAPMAVAPAVGAGPVNKGTRATMPATTNRPSNGLGGDRRFGSQQPTAPQPPAPLHRPAAPAPQATANRDATSAPALARPDALARGALSARAFPARSTSTGLPSSRSNVGNGALASSRSNGGSPSGALASSRSSAGVPSSAGGMPPPRTMPQTTPRVGAQMGSPAGRIPMQSSPGGSRVLPTNFSSRTQLPLRQMQ